MNNLRKIFHNVGVGQPCWADKFLLGENNSQ